MIAKVWIMTHTHTVSLPLQTTAEQCYSLSLNVLHNRWKRPSHTNQTLPNCEWVVFTLQYLISSIYTSYVNSTIIYTSYVNSTIICTSCVNSTLLVRNMAPLAWHQVDVVLQYVHLYCWKLGVTFPRCEATNRFPSGANIVSLFPLWLWNGLCCYPLECFISSSCYIKTPSVPPQWGLDTHTHTHKHHHALKGGR